MILIFAFSEFITFLAFSILLNNVVFEIQVELNIKTQIVDIHARKTPWRSSFCRQYNISIFVLTSVFLAFIL